MNLSGINSKGFSQFSGDRWSASMGINTCVPLGISYPPRWTVWLDVLPLTEAGECRRRDSLMTQLRYSSCSSLLQASSSSSFKTSYNTSIVGMVPVKKKLPLLLEDPDKPVCGKCWKTGFECFDWLNQLQVFRGVWPRWKTSGNITYMERQYSFLN